MKTINIKITFIEGLLGTLTSDKDIYREYISSKAPTPELTDEEVEAFDPDEAFEKGTTIFVRDADGDPALYDYAFKGFFKEASSMLRRVPGTKSSKLKAFKKVVDGLIFPAPRMIKLVLPEDAELICNQRPLRAETAQGPRIALASSEEAPAGTTCEVGIKFLDEGLEPVIMEWLDYGELHGMGAWRNSGQGAFTYEVLES